MSKEALEAKKAIVEEIKSHVENSKSVVFLNYQGINVEQDTTLRKRFREKEVVYKIYKNRLIKDRIRKSNVRRNSGRHVLPDVLRIYCS